MSSFRGADGTAMCPLIEPNARCNDNLGLHMPLSMVPTNFYCERSPAFLMFFSYRRHSHHCVFLQILFLNKDDIFKEKIKHSDIKNHFPVRERP